MIWPQTVCPFSRSFFPFSYSNHWVFQSTKNSSCIQICPLFLSILVMSHIWACLLLVSLIGYPSFLKDPENKWRKQRLFLALSYWRWYWAKEHLYPGRRNSLVLFLPAIYCKQKVRCDILYTKCPWRAIGKAGLGEGVQGTVNVLIGCLYFYLPLGFFLNILVTVVMFWSTMNFFSTIWQFAFQLFSLMLSFSICILKGLHMYVITITVWFLRLLNNWKMLVQVSFL